jgi:hypothetical protein
MRVMCAHASLAARFNDIIHEPGSVARDVSELVTLLVTMNCYFQLPAFDRLLTVHVSFPEDVLYRQLRETIGAPYQ